MRNKAEFLKAMGHPVRLCILDNLRQNESCTVTHFLSCMQASQSTISQHLAKLRAQNIVAVKKEGTHAHYYIKDSKAVEILKLMQEDEEVRNKK